MVIANLLLTKKSGSAENLTEEDYVHVSTTTNQETEEENLLPTELNDFKISKRVELVSVIIKMHRPINMIF